MQPNGTLQERELARRNWTSRAEVPLLARFAGKLVLDILPAALASVIGGFLFTQYQFGHSASQAPTVQVAPASAEMMALVRDEHAMIIDYLKTQVAAEKNRHVAEDADSARAVADAQAADAKAAVARQAAEATTRRMAAALAAKTVAPHVKAPVVAAVAPAHAPLVIAQANLDTPQNGGVTPDDRLARDPDSLLAKTLDIKDHVVAATRHVVFLIGDVFSSVGDRITGGAPATRQFSSDS